MVGQFSLVTPQTSAILVASLGAPQRRFFPEKERKALSCWSRCHMVTMNSVCVLRKGFLASLQKFKFIPFPPFPARSSPLLPSCLYLLSLFANSFSTDIAPGYCTTTKYVSVSTQLGVGKEKEEGTVQGCQV